jgi:hypothetical protein
MLKIFRFGRSGRTAFAGDSGFIRPKWENRIFKVLLVIDLQKYCKKSYFSEKKGLSD